jgi:hypothetical protein
MRERTGASRPKISEFQCYLVHRRRRILHSSISYITTLKYTRDPPGLRAGCFVLVACLKVRVANSASTSVPGLPRLDLGSLT